MKDQYVVLTGSKNNAGDYLIKHRAKNILKELRQDRKIIDYNAWEKFDNKRLEEINASKALILLGGPALQSHMRPKIYPMVDDLNDIKAPVIMMGVGWKSINGEWRDTYGYTLSEESIELLRKINDSGYQSSVRDYHTLNVLQFMGCDNFVMTGCPAYYDIPSIGKSFEVPIKIERVAFSLGVSFIKSVSMERLMKENILRCKEYFSDKHFEVVFHHSLDKEAFLSTHNATLKHVNKHMEFSSWLESEGVKYIDISGSAESLMNYYSNIDLHVGYRFHAHVFMNSISKPSIVIAEDGRAKASRNVIGGIVLDGYSRYSDNFLSKVLSKIFVKYDRYEPNNHLTKELVSNVSYEESVKYCRMRSSRSMIDNNYNVMKYFAEQLP